MALTHQWPQPTCDAPNASIHHQSLQPAINTQMQKLELVTILKKNLNKNSNPIINKQPNSY